MSNATNNTNDGTHKNHWTATATQSGTYDFATGGKYVDRNIDLVIPQAVETVSGLGSVTVPVGVGAKNSSNKYPFTGTQTTKNTGTVTATVSTAGFTDSETYTGDVNVTGRVSGTMNAIGLSASGTASATINSIMVDTKTGVVYPIKGSQTISGTASASVSSTGYGSVGVETGSGSVTGTARLSASLPAASATVTGSGTANKPTIAADATNDNISIGTITKTKPSSGYYAAIKATAPATEVTMTTAVDTAGFLGDISEINASGEIAAKTGDTYYLPITKATATGGTTTVNSSTKVVTRGTFDVTEGYINGTDGDLAAATFANTATSGKTYVDISDTAEAPVLISNDYLYINKGYTDDLKISLAKLVPDLEGYTMAGSGDMLSGKTLYDKDGKPVTGTIAIKTQSDLSATGATVTVPAGYYASQVTKSVTSGSVNSYTINETTQASVIASVTDTTATNGYYPVKVASLTGTVNRTAGYISGTTSTAADSNGGVVGKIKEAEVLTTDSVTTDGVNANIQKNLPTGTYETSEVVSPVGGPTYTYYVTASASANVGSKKKTVKPGYVGSDIDVSTDAFSDSTSSSIYLLDSTSKVGTTVKDSGSTIDAGTTLTISKGYYPTDRTFTAQTASAAAGTEKITGTLNTSITSGYTAPTLVDTAAANTPYITITGNGNMTQGKVYNGTATAKTQYLEVYAGTYSVS